MTSVVQLRVADVTNVFKEILSQALGKCLNIVGLAELLHNLCSVFNSLVVINL